MKYFFASLLDYLLFIKIAVSITKRVTQKMADNGDANLFGTKKSLSNGKGSDSYT